MLVPGGIIGQAVGQAILPFLSRDIAEGKEQQANAATAQAVESTALLGTIAAVGLAVLAQPMVELVYLRGAFSPSAAAATAAFLAIVSAALPGFCVSGVVSRGFYARSMTLRPMIVSSLVAVASVPMYGWFAAHHQGPGLAIASAAGASVNAWTLCVALDRRVAAETSPASFRGVALGLVLSLPAAAATYGIVRLAREFRPGLPPTVWAMLVLTIGGGCFALMTLVALLKYRREMVAPVLARVGRRVPARLRRLLPA